MKLDDIAKMVGGSVKGDGTIEITDVRSVEDAGEGHITFLAKKKFLGQLQRGGASAVLVGSEIETDKAQVVVGNATLAFARVLAHMYPDPRPAPGTHPQAVIGENVTLGKDVSVCALAVVGDNSTVGDGTVLYPGVAVGEDCRIGNHCTIHPNVTLYRNMVIGNHVTLHAGVVVGADGFGYTLDEKGRHFKINQTGNVVIEDHVEVGANTCIDRATLGTTVIREGTKIDNLVQVAHNCTVGEHSILVAQVGLAGSCKLGHHVVLAGQSGVLDHVTLGDHVTLMARTVAVRDIESNSVHGGFPNVPQSTWKRYVTTLPKLPDLARKVKELESRLNEIENK